ncbi:hypothetical protein GCM10011491_46720 [Brucella endophytica]|uniref:Uncharacterized protein n=1 Tax=Brucella endophytica TaxID=1963359 RepID=A0A916WM79_9HYPH|nr:hypothetical protein GCM10011491_46720 [Brucella endophytica]
MKPEFPAAATKEFLLIDLVNNLKRLAEDETQLLERAKVADLPWVISSRID